MSKVFRWIGVIFLLLSAAAAFMFWDRYWRWRDCFNELGRCFDPHTSDVHLEQSGVAWGTLTLLFVVLALLALAKAAQSNRADSGDGGTAGN